MVDPHPQGNPEGAMPPGSTPEGTADNVPIMASEGEYVIPEAVVRFIGLDKLEKMVAKAQETLATMEQSGRIGGQSEDEAEEGDDELPFDPNTLEGAEAVPHMAEGGVVSDGGGSPNMFDQKAGFTGVKQFEANGKITFIPFINGEPITPIPSGFKEVDPAAPSDPTTSTSPEKSETGVSMESSAKENDAFVEANRSNLSRDPSTWTVDDFVNFGKQKDDVGSMAMRGIISMMPLGKVALQVRERTLDNASAKYFDQMLETGKDLQGNLLTDTQRVSLEATRENLKQNMAEESGLNLNPLQRLGDVFDRVSNFLNPTAAAATMSSRSGPVGSPASSLSPEGTAMVSGSGYDSQGGATSGYGGGSYSVGSDMGRDPSSGPSEGSIASGGLYKKGGLVKRRKK